jgi:hypothetical protein
MMSRADTIQAEFQSVCPLTDSCTHLCWGTVPTGSDWSLGLILEAWPARPGVLTGPALLEPRSCRWKDRSMESPTEKQIMNRAYEIWERNGRPEGREDEFWHQAEQELRAEQERGDPAKGTPDDI